MCLAEWCLILVETDNSLPCATLFSNFSESKKLQKIFAAQTPPRKRGYVEDFAFQNILPLRNFKKLSFRIVHEIVLRNRRATSARMGLVSKHGLVDIMPNFYAMSRCGMRKLYLGCASVDFYCYYTVNRTYFSAQLAYGKMTFTNVSFMFGWCGVKIRFCFAGTK